VKNKERNKFIAETLFVVFVYSMCLVGLHTLITRIFNFGNKDSFIILVPVFLVSFPAMIYGYYLGFRRYYRKQNDSLKFKDNNIKSVSYRVLLIGFLCFVFSMILVVWGIYIIIAENSYILGVVISLFGAVIMIPVANVFYKSIKIKGVTH
jgi:hypothetical protein